MYVLFCFNYEQVYVWEKHGKVLHLIMTLWHLHFIVDESNVGFFTRVFISCDKY